MVHGLALSVGEGCPAQSPAWGSWLRRGRAGVFSGGLRWWVGDRELQWVCRVSAETEVKLKVSRAGDDGFFYILIVPVATSPRTCLSSQHRNFGSTSKWGTM